MLCSRFKQISFTKNTLNNNVRCRCLTTTNNILKKCWKDPFLISVFRCKMDITKMSSIRFLLKDLKVTWFWSVWSRNINVSNVVRRCRRDRSVREVIQCVRQTFLKSRKPILLASAAYKIDGEGEDDEIPPCEKNITDEDLQNLLTDLETIQDLKKKTLYCKKCNERIVIDKKLASVKYCTCKEPDPPEPSPEGWVPYMEADDVIIWRKEYKPGQGLYAYKVYGRYKEVSAQYFAAIQVDGGYRRVWDSAVAALSIVERSANGVLDQAVLHWEVLWPRLFANRDYVYIRRHKEFDLSAQVVPTPVPTTDQNPAPTGQNPATTGQNPATTGQNPATTGQTPTAKSQNPTTAQKPPTPGQNPGYNVITTGKIPRKFRIPTAPAPTPVTTVENPDTSEQNPDTTGQNPDTTGQNPAMTVQNPNTAGQKPGSPGQNPGYNVITTGKIPPPKGHHSILPHKHISPGHNQKSIEKLLERPSVHSNAKRKSEEIYKKGEEKAEEDKGDRAFVIVSRSCVHPEVPETKHAIRVTEYWSHMVVRTLNGADHPGMEFVLTYYDEPAVGGMPPGVASWATGRAAPAFLMNMRKAANSYKEYVSRRRAKDAPDFTPFRPDKVSYDEEAKSRQTERVSEEDMESSKQGPELENGEEIEMTREQYTQTECEPSVEEKAIGTNINYTIQETPKKPDNMTDDSGKTDEDDQNATWWRSLYPFYYFV